MESNAIDWRVLLAGAVKAAGKKGKVAVALRMGVSRSYVSRAMSTGNCAFDEVPQSFIERVINTFHVVACPARNGEVSFSECHRANLPCPTSNARDARHWRACQACPNKPAKE